MISMVTTSAAAGAAGSSVLPPMDTQAGNESAAIAAREAVTKRRMM
jgi:hypothetical protein